MFKKLKPWLWALVLIAAAVGVYYLIKGGPTGPIIVIQPEPEGGGLATASSDFTHWYVDRCRGNVRTRLEATRDYTYFGVPGALSSRLGASRIVVTLKSGPTFEAATIDMELNNTRPPLTIARPLSNGTLDPSGVPKWNFDTRIVPHNGKKQVYEWSNDLYGHITKLEYVDTTKDMARHDVLVEDLKSIEIFYNPLGTCP